MAYSESLIYVNSSGEMAVLSGGDTEYMWELLKRSGFTAPDVELITQKYVNGINKVLGRIVLPRTVRMNFVLVGDDVVERDERFAELVAKLMNVEKGENGKLYVGAPSGKGYVLNCAYSSGLNITDEYKKFHRFTLEFYASDPYFYSEEEVSYIDLEASDVITLSDDLTLGGWCLGWGDLSGTGMVDNQLGQSVDPVFRISGSRASLKITNLVTGKSLEFADMDLEPTDTIIIDTRERYKTAYVLHANGKTDSILGNMIWTTTDLSLPLATGNNTFSVKSFGEIDKLEVAASLSYLSA